MYTGLSRAPGHSYRRLAVKVPLGRMRVGAQTLGARTAQCARAGGGAPGLRRRQAGRQAGRAQVTHLASSCSAGSSATTGSVMDEGVRVSIAASGSWQLALAQRDRAESEYRGRGNV